MQWQGVKTILRLRTYITDLFMSENAELSPVFMQFATKKVITTPFSVLRSAASSDFLRHNAERKRFHYHLCRRSKAAERRFL